MVLMALGMNYQTAPIGLREKLAFTRPETEALVQDLLKEGIASEAVLISTCNRTELYYEGGVIEEALRWLAKKRSLTWEDLLPYIYHYSDSLAVKHLLRVAIGLDSMVIGEVEILGQIKSAYRTAAIAGSLGRYLDRLFQFTFGVAKQVRKESGIGINPVSIASLAVRLSEKIFSRLTDLTVLLIGAGNLIRITAEHFRAKGVKKILVANRTLAQTLKLKARFETEILSLEEIPQRLAEADIVISGTASELPIIGKGMVESALKLRKHRPMYMVDLAIPRDIEPETGNLEDVYLYCIDDLQHLALENRLLRQTAANLAEERIQQEVEQFMGWLRSNTAFKTVQALREKYESTKLQVLSRGLQQLSLGKPPEKVLQEALNGLTNRLLHDPTLKLRQAGFDSDTHILQHTRYLFDLNDETIDTR